MRLSSEEAAELLAHGDLIALGRAADAERARRFGDTVTFIVDRNINYTNICVNECRFCALYTKPGAADSYLLPMEEILEKVGETAASGGTQVMIQGGIRPDLPLSYYENMLRAIRDAYPSIVIHSFTATEILYFAEKEGITIEDMRTAHRIGMASTATMVIGFGETPEERVEHMEHIRRLQEETGGFRAFITWTFQPGNTALGGEKTSSWDYMRTLAVTRLYMDNVLHIQGSWVTQGERIGQLTLGFGADDLGSIMLEENVVRAAGTAYNMSIRKMIELIRGAGREPAQRDTRYRVIRRF